MACRDRREEKGDVKHWFAFSVSQKSVTFQSCLVLGYCYPTRINCDSKFYTNLLHLLHELRQLANKKYRRNVRELNKRVFKSQGFLGSSVHFCLEKIQNCRVVEDLFAEKCLIDWIRVENLLEMLISGRDL